MNRLLELRTAEGLSQRAVAKALFVSQGTYNNWENGRTQPSIEQLIELSKFFGESIDFIVGNKVDDKEKSAVKAQKTAEYITAIEKIERELGALKDRISDDK